MTSEQNKTHLGNKAIEASDFQAPTGKEEKAPFQYRPIHAVLLLSAFLLIGFISFISLARSIQVIAVAEVLSDSSSHKAQPASVEILSKVKLPIGNRYLVLPGKHQVAVSAKGFVEVQQAIDVGQERHQQFEIEIARLPGVLEIPLPEGTSAEIFLNGESFVQLASDANPASVNNVPAGSHLLTVDAALYRPVTKQILVQGEEKRQRVELKFTPAWAEYEISSSPADAALFIDGEQVGSAPAKIKIEEGTRLLEVKAEGFKTFKQELGVVASQHIQLPSITLLPADGELALESQPSGAAILINDEFIGLTPKTVAVAPNREQKLRVYKAGYKLAEQAISFAPAEKQSKQISLTQDLISVKFSINPADAQLYVDGQRRGSGSINLSLNSLPHSVSVRKAGYVTQNMEIVPTRGNQQLVSVQLLTNEQDYWSKIPASYANKSGHQMKLFKSPGRVKMGSSRREDGRRANEVMYDAELTRPFYVSLHETSNKQFRAFKPTHNSGNYKKKSLDANKAPVVNISWQQAALYCNWLSEREGLDPFYQTKSGYVSGYNKDANGYRLLTEAEWAWLARENASQPLIYPWGKSKSAPSKKVENLADESAKPIITFTLAGYQDGYKGPAPVGRFPENHRGLFDMGGNVSEWVHDWYSAKGSSELSKSGVIRDPFGPDIGEYHVVRGPSWAKGHLPQLRLAYRDYGAKGKYDVGFRIARYAGLNKSKRGSSEVVKQ